MPPADGRAPKASPTTGGAITARIRATAVPKMIFKVKPRTITLPLTHCAYERDSERDEELRPTIYVPGALTVPPGSGWQV